MLTSKWLLNPAALRHLPHHCTASSRRQLDGAVACHGHSCTTLFIVQTHSCVCALLSQGYNVHQWNGRLRQPSHTVRCANILIAFGIDVQRHCLSWHDCGSMLLKGSSLHVSKGPVTHAHGAWVVAASDLGATALTCFRWHDVKRHAYLLPRFMADSDLQPQPDHDYYVSEGCVKLLRPLSAQPC